MAVISSFKHCINGLWCSLLNRSPLGELLDQIIRPVSDQQALPPVGLANKIAWLSMNPMPAWPRCFTLGKIAHAQGDLAAAYAALTEALPLAVALGPHLMVVVAMEWLPSLGYGPMASHNRLNTFSICCLRRSTRTQPAQQAKGG